MLDSDLHLQPEGPPERPQAPNNLPIDRGRLIGRDREVHTVCHLLAEPHVRLLTLAGPGGVGKTRLALQVAREMLEQFEDGVYLVELASIAEAGLVIPTAATVLQVPEEPSAPLLSTLIAHLRDKRMLLVLDNFEQVIPAGPALAEILDGCPDLKLLATSRAPLGLRAEHEFELSPLAIPDMARRRSHRPGTSGVAVTEGSAELLRYGAIELFVQRAGRMDSAFELTDQNAGSVVEVCRRVDGLPLGIELVAAHARLLSPKSILARLTHPLRLLMGGPQGAPSRHRTMHDTIEWSYRLLDEGEQRLFRGLSVFVGGFSVQAAEAVCGGGMDEPLSLEVLSGLETLVDKSLVRRLDGEEQGEGGTDGESRLTRLAMLELVREYALEHMQESGESETRGQRHAEYFLTLAEEAEPHLAGPDQRTWVALLEAEHNNLRAALSWCLTSITSSVLDYRVPSMGLRLAGALWQFWAGGHLGEGRRWLQAALEAVEQPDEGGLGEIGVESRALAKAQVKALNGAGMLARLAGDFPAGRQVLHSGLEVSRRLGDLGDVATTLANLGIIALLQGNYAEARGYLNESLAIRRDLGLDLEVGQCLTHLGNVAMMEGSYAEAQRLHEEGLAIYLKAGDKEGVGHALHSLATIARREGRLGEARRLGEETLAIARELGNKQGIAYSLRDLGNVAYEQADYRTAHNSLLESLALFRDLEDVMATIDNLMGLARVAARTGQLEHAVRLFGTMSAMLESTEGRLDSADSAAYEREVATLRARVSEKPFTSAWEEGRVMTLDQALELATPEAGLLRKRGSGSLTLRESEVVALAGQGLSNEEIGRMLALSERTIEMHMSSALHKLGLTRRTQLAAWAAEERLARIED
jgi:predicted ATPase/DNA-binding CsgD family transcriptional regulator